MHDDSMLVANWVGFAFGKSAGGVIATSFFTGDGVESFDQYNNWMFQWAFAGTSKTIMSGSVLERITIWGSFISPRGLPYGFTHLWFTGAGVTMVGSRLLGSLTSLAVVSFTWLVV